MSLDAQTRTPADLRRLAAERTARLRGDVRPVAARPAPPRSAVPTEHAEQAELFRRLADLAALGGPFAACGEAFACPNGGHRHKAVAGRLKAEGVRRGIPDVLLLVPSGQWHGLALELKRRNAPPSAVSPEQRWWHERLHARGFRVVVARGADEAVTAVCEYLGLPNDAPPRRRGEASDG
jgi:hypothetical protein